MESTAARRLLQPADRGRINAEGPCHGYERFAISEAPESFLPLVLVQLFGRPKRTPRLLARFLPSSVRALIR